MTNTHSLCHVVSTLSFLLYMWSCGLEEEDNHHMEDVITGPPTVLHHVLMTVIVVLGLPAFLPH